LASPEPLPKRDPIIAHAPLLPDIRKGQLLLADDMEQQQYLAPLYNQGESYRGGQLHLNAIHLTPGYVACFYPAPFDQLANFIIEGVVEFQPIPGQFNRVSVFFRNHGDLQTSSSYHFYWNQQGMFGVNQWRLANPFPLVPLQASPALKRDGQARWNSVPGPAVGQPP